ncbi:MAG: LapA family protein [Gammaproteobacteria bacterium]|nr:LapA family protein [Gammaproteobacteria bacterium]
MKWLKSLTLVIAMLLAFAVAALAANQEELALTFAYWQTPFTLSMFWWLLAAFLVGLFFGLLNAGWMSIKYRLENRKLRQSLAQSSAEVERLRITSIQG